MASLGSIAVEAGSPATREFEITWADGQARDMGGISPVFAALAADGSDLFPPITGSASGNVVSVYLPALAEGSYSCTLTLMQGGSVAPDGKWTGTLEVDGVELRALASLDALKAFLFGTDAAALAAADDTLLANLLERSSAWVESQVGYPLLAASYSHTFDGNGSQALVLRAPNVKSVSQVTVEGSAISARSLTSDGWALSGDCLHLVPALGQRSTTLAFPRGIQNVDVTYVAGFTSPPEDIVGVVAELAAMAYRRKDVLNLMTRSVAGEYIQYQTNSLPVHIKSVLDTYRKVTVG